MDQPPGTEAAPKPAAVLSYRSAVPGNALGEVTFEREGEVLTITIPPGPVVLKIIWRSVLLFLFVFPIVGITIGVVSSLIGGGLHGGGDEITCIGFTAVFLVLAALATLGSILRLERNRKVPSIVRVWPAGIEVETGETRGTTAIRLPRDRIADVRIHPANVGFSHRVQLEIASTDDTLHVAAIPWPRGYPMIALEDNIRDVLRLPPEGFKLQFSIRGNNRPA
jgi:hypothetical protein